MKKVFLVITSTGHWGRGATIWEAMNNAKVEFAAHCKIFSIKMKDESNLTPEQVKSVYGDDHSVTHPVGSTYELIDTICLRYLDCVSNAERLEDKNRELNYKDIKLFEDAFDNIGIQV